MQIKEINVRSLILEVTRRCNMSCKHCLRGDAQDLDMSIEIIDRVLPQLHSVDEITFSGGEPFLAPMQMERVTEYYNRITVEPLQRFWISTNGTICTDRILEVLENLRDECQDPDACYIQISGDPYHTTNWETADELMRDLEGLEISCGLHRPETGRYAWVLAMGRGRDIPNARKRDWRIEIPEWEFDPDTGVLDLLDTDLYISAVGDVLLDCDMSYDLQRDYRAGSILEQSLAEILIPVLVDFEDEYPEVTGGVVCNLGVSFDNTSVF